MTRRVRLFTPTDAIEVLTEDDAPTPIVAQRRSIIACARHRTVRKRYQEKRRAVRAFVEAFERHYGDEPAIALILQPRGAGARTVALVLPLSALLEIRDALAGFRLNDDPKREPSASR